MAVDYVLGSVCVSVCLSVCNQHSKQHYLKNLFMNLCKIYMADTSIEFLENGFKLFGTDHIQDVWPKICNFHAGHFR